MRRSTIPVQHPQAPISAAHSSDTSRSYAATVSNSTKSSAPDVISIIKQITDIASGITNGKIKIKDAMLTILGLLSLLLNLNAQH